MKPSLLVLILAVTFAQLAKAQDSTTKAKPTRIVKLSIANPAMYLMYSRFGMKYFGVAYEKFRNSKTSFNHYLDYYYIQDGSFNNTGEYDPYPGTLESSGIISSTMLDNFGTKNILSYRTLYKWYPLHKRRFGSGFYIAGGINAAARYTHKAIDDDWGDYNDFSLYGGLGWGMGYRLEIKKRFSVELFFHRASNGVKFGIFTSNSSYEPIAVVLWDISVGYVLNSNKK